MDNSQPTQSILETLRTVEFRLGLKGYNVDEVDEYLEKAAVEAEAMQEQFRQLTDRLRQATERIGVLEGSRPEPAAAPAGGPAAEASTEALQRTLLLAQKFVDQTKAESEAEAAEILNSAQAEARKRVGEAEEHARKMVADSQQQLREEVSRLESVRGQLAGDVENMAKHLEGERNRLRGALSEMLKWVDDNVQPANSLMALRPVGGAGEGAPSRPLASSGASTAGNGSETSGPGAQVLNLRDGAPIAGTSSEHP